MKALKILGYVAAATIAVTIAVSYADIRRYIKIEMM